MSTTTMRAPLAALLIALTAACSSDGRADGPVIGSGSTGATTDGVLAAWKAASLVPATDLVATDAARLGGGACKVGVVDGLEVTLCEHPSDKAAAAAHDAGLAAVGDATGAALVNGRLLMVVADRKKNDPQGRTLNKIAKAFQGARE